MHVRIAYALVSSSWRSGKKISGSVYEHGGGSSHMEGPGVLIPSA